MNFRRTETLSPGEEQDLVALQPVTVPAHWHHVVAEGQDPEVEGQAVWQGATLLLAQESTRNGAHENCALQDAHAGEGVQGRNLLLGPFAATGRHAAVHVQ